MNKDMGHLTVSFQGEHGAYMKALAALGTRIGDLADVVTTKTLVAAEV